ncbi:hypothetical protein [Streptosporangium sp. NPDC051022]|uniref:hypothetical protein n=1 Tax=Streptosporangium sp. NPDC051022 TaxID=3155752 RepID=UPI003448E417
MAPLDPPVSQQPEEPERDTPPSEIVSTPAAPLEPPTSAPAEVPPVAPEPGLRHTVMPGAEFEDLIGEDGNPIDPDKMFVAAGPDHLTYVRTAQRITRRHYYLGATHPSDQLEYSAGRRVDKTTAAALTEELKALRAARPTSGQE